MKRVMLYLLAFVLAGSLVVGSSMANPIPVMAAEVTFLRTYIECAPSCSEHIVVFISGECQEFGIIPDQTYSLFLMEDDVGDQCLVAIKGRYPVKVNATTFVEFKVIFRLECDDKSTKVTGVGVDELWITINKKDRYKQDEYHWRYGDPTRGERDIRGLFDYYKYIPEGQYDVETTGPAAGPDTNDYGNLELGIEFHWSYVMVGECTFKCLGAPNVTEEVGGIVEFPQIEEPWTVTPDLSDNNYGALAGIIAGSIAGVTALISAAWYIRRRRTKATS